MNRVVLFDASQAQVFETEILPLFSDMDIQSMAFDSQVPLRFSGETQVILWLSDEQISQVLPLAAEQHWQVGFLPHPEMNRFYRSFEFPKNAKQALEEILQVETPVKADLMLCNCEPVLASVMFGKPSTMRPASQMDDSFWSKLTHLFHFMRGVWNDALFPYKLTTAKDTQLSTAALGMTLVYRAGGSDFTRRVVEPTEQDEPAFHVLILAPRSLFEMLHFVSTKLFVKRPEKGVLPNYLGYIKTQKLTVKGLDNSY